MRILALDWGEVRVGAAISDEETKIAFPLKLAFTSENAIEEIKHMIGQQHIGLILIGLPKNLSGKEEKSAEKMKRFASELAQAAKVPVKQVDERFTSVQAGKILSAAGLSEKKQRGIKDNIAAQIMLQQYLDSKHK